MALKITVLAKQVPDTTNITGNVMKENGTINRSKLPAIFNPEDKVALEVALQLKEKYGGNVSLWFASAIAGRMLSIINIIINEIVFFILQIYKDVYLNLSILSCFF